MINFIKGIFIGIALVIPGLSGSIFAVAVGLYDKILSAVNSIRSDLKGSLRFLTPVVLGCAVGILLSTKLVLWICQAYPLPSYMFFTGLVLGSMPLVIKKARKAKPMPYLLITAAAFTAILLISNLGGATSDEAAKAYIAIEQLGGIRDFMIMIFAGAFSCSLMSIPGVSGSVMLMVINQYGTVYNAVGQIGDMLKAVLAGDMQVAVNALMSVLLVAPFGIGAVIGIALIAKLLEYTLKKYEPQVYYGVAGLVLGAVVTLLQTAFASTVQLNVITVIISVACVVVGYIATSLFND